jgi:hypothetical protein
MTIDKKAAYMQVVEFFADTLADAEESVKAGVLTPDDVVDAFVEAIDDWHTYFINSAATYASIAKAVRERVSQA